MGVNAQFWQVEGRYNPLRLTKTSENLAMEKPRDWQRAKPEENILSVWHKRDSALKKEATCKDT